MLKVDFSNFLRSELMPRNRQARLQLRACIFTLKSFSVEELQNLADVSRSSAQRYVKELLHDGLLKIVKQRRNGDRGGDVYKLTQTLPLPNWKEEQSSRNHIWSTIRILQTFTLPDLLIDPKVSESSVKKYIKYLLKVEYLKIIEPRLNGSKSYNRYLLIRNSGPIAPIICRDDTVFDPNSKIRYRIK
jgi:Fic family protein